MARRAEETAMHERKDIILVADYHSENVEFRWFDEATGEERTGRFRTSQAGILQLISQATQELEPGGHVMWIMESTARAPPATHCGLRICDCGLPVSARPAQMLWDSSTKGT